MSRTYKEYGDFGIVFLVKHIKNNADSESIESMTYTEFANRINELDEHNESTHRMVGRILERVGKALKNFDRKAPPITILIKNNYTGLPDDSVKTFCSKFDELDNHGKHKRVEKEKKRIKEYLRSGKLNDFVFKMALEGDFAASLSIMEDSVEDMEAQGINENFLDIEHEYNNSKLDGVPLKAKYVVQYKSRNGDTVRERKDQSTYRCECCDFNFYEMYGELGDKYIECHHIKPLAEFGEEGEYVDWKDLALLCANCHVMIHRLLRRKNVKYKGKYSLSMDDLKKLIKEQRAKS